MPSHPTYLLVWSQISAFRPCTESLVQLCHLGSEEKRCWALGTQVWGSQGAEGRLALVPQALRGYLGWVISFGPTTPTMQVYDDCSSFPPKEIKAQKRWGTCRVPQPGEPGADIEMSVPKPVCPASPLCTRPLSPARKTVCG